jgi:hypothetical protein
MSTSFAAMDKSTREQWMVIAEETMNNQPRVAQQILVMIQK